MPRTNLLATPSFNHGVGSWVSQYPANATIAVDSTQLINGNSSLKITSLASAGIAAYSGFGSIPVVAGQTITFTIYVKAPAGNAAAFYAISVYWSLAGVYKSYSVGTAADVIPITNGNGGVWTRYSFTTVVPASRDGAAIVIPPTTNLGNGYVFWIGNAMAEVGPAPAGSYFDGDTPADTSYTYAWAGTPGASESIATEVVSSGGAHQVNVGGVAQTPTRKVNVGGVATSVTRQVKSG